MCYLVVCVYLCSQIALYRSKISKPGIIVESIRYKKIKYLQTLNNEQIKDDSEVLKSQEVKKGFNEIIVIAL